MEEIILDILAELRAGREVDDRTLLKLSHAAARREQADKRAFAKRRLLPFYQSVKREDPARWAVSYTHLRGNGGPVVWRFVGGRHGDGLRLF